MLISFYNQKLFILPCPSQLRELKVRVRREIHRSADEFL